MPWLVAQLDTAVGAISRPLPTWLSGREITRANSYLEFNKYSRVGIATSGEAATAIFTSFLNHL